MTARIYYGWWVVCSCFLVNVYTGSVTFYGFTAFIEPIIQEFGWSYTQVSLAASLRGLEVGLFAPVVGFLVDRYSFRRVLLGGVISIGLGLFLLSLTTSLPMFYASFFLIALGAGGSTSVVTMSAVADWFKKNLGIALGITLSGYGASGLLVPVIAWLIDCYTWRTTLVILGAGMWILGIPLSFVIKTRREQTAICSDMEYHGREDQVFPKHAPSLKGGFTELVRKRAFLILACIDAIRVLTASAVITHIMPYLSSVGVSRTSGGFLAAAIPLSSIAGRIMIGWLGDFIDKRIGMAVSSLLMGAGVAVLGLAHAPWSLAFFILLFPPGFGGGMVLRGAILRETFGGVSFGRLLGSTMLFASVGSIAGPALAGWVYDTLGSYEVLWVSFAGMHLLAMALIGRVK